MVNLSVTSVGQILFPTAVATATAGISPIAAPVAIAGVLGYLAISRTDDRVDEDRRTKAALNILRKRSKSVAWGHLIY